MNCVEVRGTPPAFWHPFFLALCLKPCLGVFGCSGERESEMLASAVCGGAAVRRSVVSGVRWMALRPTAASWAAESGGGAEPDLQPEETPVNVTFGQISAAA